MPLSAWGILEEFTAFECSVLPSKEIRPKGDIPIGAALELALGKLKEQNARYRRNNWSSVTPELVLLSDGISSDDFSRVASLIRQLSGKGALRCRAIALGETHDLDALRRIAGENVMLLHHGEMKHAFAEIGRVISECYEAEASTKMIEAVGEILSDTPSSCSADFSAASFVILRCPVAREDGIVPRISPRLLSLSGYKRGSGGKGSGLSD